MTSDSTTEGHADASTTTLDEDLVQRVLAAFPAATRVVLFRSRATGRHRSDSDVDLLVVTPTNEPPWRRNAHLRRALRGLPYAFDLVIVTPAEYERLHRWRSTVVRGGGAPRAGAA